MAKVGAAVAAAELTRDRLQAALPRLRARYTEVRKQEDIAAWKAEAEKLAARRDELRMEFMRILPVELIKRIPEHLKAMRAFDKEIDALNYRRPDDQSVRSLHYATPELARELRIPNMEKPGHVPVAAANRLSELLAAIPTDPFIISEAAKGTYENARYKRVLEDNRRQIDEAERASASSRHARPPKGRPTASGGDAMTSALNMLHRASWQAEKLFKARGHLRTIVWCTETKDGRRQLFETACEVERAEIFDARRWLRCVRKLAADFAADGVARYAEAFPASATITLQQP